MLNDKAMIETITPLMPLVDVWCVCSLLSDENDRGSDGKIIADFLQSQKIKNGYTFHTVSDAMYFLAQAHCQKDCDRALIFGSFYTVAAAKNWIAKNKGECEWKKEQNKD